MVLDESAAVLGELLALVRDHQVKGKQVHDATIVATLRAKSDAREPGRGEVMAEEQNHADRHEPLVGLIEAERLSRS